MRQERQRAFTSILIPLVSAILAWILYIAALFVDIAIDVTVPMDYLFGEEAAQLPRPSRYLFFAAVAIFALGSLWARKRLEPLINAQPPGSALVRPAHGFTGTVIIIGLVVAAWAALAVFLDSFFMTGSFEVPVDVRLWNTYVPIILYTALVVGVLLAAFVFGKHRVASKPGAVMPGHSGDSGAAVTEVLPAQQRLIALAFALPIIAVAVAFIFGLIVFDTTQTALQVWIWVIIQIIIAAGIIAASWFARRGFDAMDVGNRPVTGVVVGAKNLNVVLSIIFAAVVAVMSLGYGSSATEQLRLAPSLTLSVYENEPKEPTNAGDSFDADATVVTVNGSDLERLSEVTLILNPGEQEIASGRADREGFFWIEQEFPAGTQPGAYVLEAVAVAADGAEIRRTVPVVLGADGTLTLPEGDAGSDPSNWQPRLMPITAGWLVSDLLPAFLLLVLSASSVALTLSIRNRDVSSTGETQATR